MVSVDGRLDGVTSKTLDAHLNEQFAAGVSRLVLDLAKVDYVSSFGLRLVLLAAKKLNGPGKRFGVCCLTENVRQTFTISGFSSIIAIHDTVEDAVSAARQ